MNGDDRPTSRRRDESDYTAHELEERHGRFDDVTAPDFARMLHPSLRPARLPHPVFGYQPYCGDCMVLAADCSCRDLTLDDEVAFRRRIKQARYHGGGGAA